MTPGLVKGSSLTAFDDSATLLCTRSPLDLVKSGDGTTWYGERSSISSSPDSSGNAVDSARLAGDRLSGDSARLAGDRLSGDSARWAGDRLSVDNSSQSQSSTVESGRVGVLVADNSDPPKSDSGKGSSGRWFGDSNGQSDWKTAEGQSSSSSAGVAIQELGLPRERRGTKSAACGGRCW